LERIDIRHGTQQGFLHKIVRAIARKLGTAASMASRTDG
jgi:hypothetical protein